MNAPRRRRAGTGGGGGAAAGDRLFACLLRACPRRFRARFADEMRAVFAAHRRAEWKRAGRRGLAQLWARTFVDMAATAAAAWHGELARCARRRRGAPARGWRSAGPPPGMGGNRPPARKGDGWMENLRNDLRQSLRMLVKAPGFTAAAVLTLGLGLGATSAIFSVVDAVLLRPLSYAAPERLLALWEQEQDGSRSNTSYATFVDWKSRSHTLAQVAALSYWTANFSDGRRAERLEGTRVTQELFGLLGVRPALGRDFLPQEDIRGNHHVVIVSYGLWQRMGGDPRLIGKPVRLDGIPYTLVGVLPPSFESLLSTYSDRPAQIWAPLAYNASLPYACRTCRHLRAVARLRPGSSAEQARRELGAISVALYREYPRDYARPGVVVTPFAEDLLGAHRRTLYVLLGAVGFVLTIACANVTSLLLVRTRKRQGELAIRAALGAGRGRLVRQLLTENAVLYLLGAALGLLLAAWGVRVLVHAEAAGLPRLGAAGIDGRALGVTLALSLLSAIAFGLFPACRFSRAGLRPRLTAGGRVTRSGRRFDGLLVVGDLALALLLLIGAGLMLATLTRLLSVRAGFDGGRLLTAEVSVAGPRYRDHAKVLELYERALARLRALPGVTAAAVVSQLPLSGNADGYGMHFADRPAANPADDPSALRYAVSPDYLRAMRIPIRRGRGFTAWDRAGAQPVVLINETFAHRIWPGQDPLGKRIKMGDPELPWRTVVGVVGDVLHEGLDAAPAMQIYLPQAQWIDSDMTLVLRTAGEPRDLAPAVRKAMGKVDPDQPLSHLASMREVISSSLARRRFTLELLALFAGIAVLLAMIGIYGVLSYSVAERSHEIGVRMALGADPRRVLAMVMTRSVRLTALGLAAGGVLAWGLTRFLASLLFEVSPTDPAIYAALAALLALVAFLASYLPARRAARLDPLTAVRAGNQ
jgi:putative ABC transport system permease protein